MTTQAPQAVASRGTGRGFAGHWHYRPAVPIRSSPLFVWPPKPAKIAAWVGARWFRLAENSILVLSAVLCWTYWQPSLAETRSLAPGWIAEIYFRNLLLMVLVAGGLHLFFYRWRRQGDTLRFDTQEPKKNRSRFTFGSQLRDNVFWTLASGVFFWTAYEVLMFWAMANGYAPLLLWGDSPIGPIWFVALIFLTPIWISFHFYWVHRWLHWPPLYKLAHALHHRNVNVGPWSGLSMHPIEHLIFFSSVLVHFVVAAHPIHILFHMQHQALTAATSHTGFEGVLAGNRLLLALGTFHHQMHHRYFECNYGNLECPLDIWAGSFHDGTPQAHDGMKARLMRRRQHG